MRARLPLIVLLAAALVAAPTAAAIDQKQARALLRLTVKLSGLQAREQVRIVVERPAAFRQRSVKLLDRGYSRSAQAHDEKVYRALGLTTGPPGVLRQTLLARESDRGVYDPRSRTAYIRAGNAERTAALHQLVLALQDQHYDLRRVARLPGGSDARVAATAASEGHATLVAGELARRPGAPRSGPKLKRFVELRRGFGSSVGLRFAADLRNLGGQQAVLGSLRRLPATSEQVFHLDKYLEHERARAIVLPADAAGMTLASEGSFGELDVRALLAVFGVPRLDRAGSGWGGGRTAVYRGAGGEAVAVALDWDSAADANEWAESVGTYVDKAFGTRAVRSSSECSTTACWQLGAQSIAFAQTGKRTALVLGAEETALLAGALLGTR